MAQPAKSISLAPKASWVAYKGVFRMEGSLY
jgi:hypothetical protein